MRKIIAAGFGLAAIVTGAATSALAANTCSVDEAAGQEIMSANEREVRTGAVENPLLEEMRRISGSVKGGNEHAPLRELLLPEAAERFQVLRERLFPLRISAAIESDRERDAILVVEMVTTAWEAYRNNSR